MKLGTILLAMLVVVAALVAVVWFGRYGGVESLAVTETKAPAKPLPKPAESGPQPKVVFEQTEHDFGVMEHGAEGEHTFLIRNDGEGVLELVAREEDTSCQCTVGKLTKDQLAPGESGEIVLKWEIKSPSPEFRHTAIVRTNDPEKSEVELAIKGKVERPLLILPTETWEVGDVGKDEPTVATGHLISRILDSFNVTDVTTTNERIKTDVVALDAEKLEELKAKSGYEVTVTVEPNMPLGAFQETVTLQTDTRDRAKMAIGVRGKRTGPITITGRNWFENANLVRIGEFPASQGKKHELSLYVRDLEGDLEIVDSEIDPESLQVSLAKDPKFSGNTQRYTLTFSVPPGERAVRNELSRARVILKTNHPEADTLRFSLEYLSF